jgi:hypothetical protein
MPQPTTYSWYFIMYITTAGGINASEQAILFKLNSLCSLMGSTQPLEYNWGAT